MTRPALPGKSRHEPSTHVGDRLRGRTGRCQRRGRQTAWINPHEHRGVELGIGEDVLGGLQAVELRRLAGILEVE
jgi:hypothetical protein